MIFRQKSSTTPRSRSSVERRAIRRRCSSPSATCRVAKEMSMRFFPNVPERHFFSSVRYASASSWAIMVKDWLNRETISRWSLT